MKEGIAIRALLIASLCAIVYFVLDHFLKQPAQASVASIAIIVSIWTVLENREISKKHKTIDYLSSYDLNKEVANKNVKFNEIIKYDNNFDSICSAILNENISSDNQENLDLIRQVLNGDELLALAIKNNAFDFTIVNEMMNSTITRRFSRAKKLIYTVRQKYGIPYAYMELEGLVEKMKKSAFHK